MKNIAKIAIVLITLTLCLTMLTSCGGVMETITTKLSVTVLDTVQSEFESNGFVVDRLEQEDLEYINEYSEEMFGQALEGEITGMFYATLDQEAAGAEAFTYSIVIGFSNPDDVAIVEESLREAYGEINEEHVNVDIKNFGVVLAITITEVDA